MAELYHLGVPTAAVPRLVVLLDPGVAHGPVVRAAGAARAPLASRREYVSHLGAWDGQEVLLTTVGVGAPPLAIAVEELARAGTRSFVLLGTAAFRGVTGRWLVPHGAARRDGTSAQYAPLAYPAVPDPLLRSALAAASGGSASYGLVETVDVMGPDAEDPGGSGGCVARDLRCAALFVVAAARGVRAAALLLDAARDRAGESGEAAEAALRALVSVDGRGTRTATDVRHEGTPQR